MRVTRAAVTRTCAVCDRSLLMGEHTTRYLPNGRDYVDVCPLCQDISVEHGCREGSRRRRRCPSRRGGSAVPAAPRAPAPEQQPVVSQPILRRLSPPELAIVALICSNSSSHRRTSPDRQSLGEPKASIVPLSGVSGEMIVTVIWEISWYQYRVTPDSASPVRLADRGYDVEALEPSFRAWNAAIGEDGRLVPEVARI